MYQDSAEWQPSLRSKGRAGVSTPGGMLAWLPQRMMAYTPCYRREAGAAGKDTRGLLRVHEFDKVELMAYATPEQGESVMFEIRERAHALVNALGLPPRVIEICSGDLGQAHHRSFDIEAYAPGER